MMDGWGVCLMERSRFVFGFRNGVEVTVAQVAGPVLDRARSYLSARGFTFAEEMDTRVAGEKSKFGNKVVHKLSLGRMNEVFKLLGITRPTIYWASVVGSKGFAR